MMNVVAVVVVMTMITISMMIDYGDGDDCGEYFPGIIDDYDDAAADDGGDDDGRGGGGDEFGAGGDDADEGDD